MIEFSAGTRVLLYCRPVDMRKGFNGLAALVSEVLRSDPYSGYVFLFRAKRGDYLKALYWDGTGLCLFAKRFEEGRFVWPPVRDQAMRLSSGQFALLMEGIDWRRTVALDAPRQPVYA